MICNLMIQPSYPRKKVKIVISSLRPWVEQGETGPAGAERGSRGVPDDWTVDVDHKSRFKCRADFYKADHAASL